ncbi:hypothetical protein T484DRAFT_3598118 [Baffinella frigidus]|nr:hypothetical protein T484DRAFT_3598118 [Cryptophyta sp. CCMP2293]
MPARTTVITSLSKRTNEGIQSLTANELRQMCGRAGRRGKDTVGHSVIMKSRWEGAPEGFTLVTLPADPLVSKFSPNYGMVLNLLEQRPIAECKQIVERSFGSFMAQKKKGIVAEEEVNNEDELDEAVTLLQKVDVDELKQLAKQVERLKSEERVLKFLQLQAAKNSQAVFEDTMPYAAPGTSILLRPVIDPDAGESTGPESAVLIDFAIAASDSPLAFFATLTQGNKLRIVTHQDVVEMALDADLVSIALPASPDDKEGDTMAERLMAKVPPRRNWLKDGPEAFITDGEIGTFLVLSVSFYSNPGRACSKLSP